MRRVAIVLPFLLCASVLAAVPAVTWEGVNADVVVDPGHRLAWIRYVRGTNGATAFDTGFATADASGRARIAYSATVRDLTLIVVDVETGQFTAAAAGTTNMVRWEMRPGTILRTTGGAYTQLAVSDLANSENPFSFGALWVRPGVGAWAPPGARVMPDLWGHFTFYLYDARQMVAVGPPTATPSGFARGDRLLLLKHFLWEGDRVDAQLDAAPNPGTISMLHRSPEVWQEGRSPASFWIIRTEGTEGTVGVRCCTLSGDAVEGEDYAPFEPREVVFAPGEVAKRVDFTLLQNNVYRQHSPMLTATLTNVTGGARLGSARSSAEILDDDAGAAPKVAFGDVPATVLEDDVPWTLNVPVTLTGDFHGTLRLEFSVDGIERAVEVAQGEKQKLVPVTIPGDTTPSVDRTITLAVSFNGVRVERKITILDDDGAPPVTIATTRIVEGDTERSEWIRLVLGSAATFPVRVSVAASPNGTARPGIDYSFASTVVQFAPGQTEALVPIVIKGDSIPEDDWTIVIVVTRNGQTIRTATIALVDDDTPAVSRPRIVIDDITVKETDGGTDAVFTVRLSRASAEQVRVAWTTSDGTASAPDDYQRASGLIAFAPGETRRTVTVRIAGDRIEEAGEWFALDLAAAEGASIDDARAVCTIEDDDRSAPGRRRSARS